MQKQNRWRAWLQLWQLDDPDGVDPETLQVFILGTAFGLVLSMVLDLL